MIISLLHLSLLAIAFCEKYQWTWLGGSLNRVTISNNSVATTPIPSNYPRGRTSHSGAINPLTNDFIIFGGFIPSSAYLNDMWSFNPFSNMWTLLHGNKAVNELGVYGTKGISSPLNYPGSRRDHAMDVHPVSGLLVVFGGDAYDGSSIGSPCNDLWTFDFTSKQWAWISGSDSFYEYGNYGTKGVSSATNVPGARYGHSLNIHPQMGIVVVFGGYGLDSSSGGTLNDLWSFSMISNHWTWISGSQTAGSAGTISTPRGIASTTNEIGAREYHSSAINSLDGTLMIFGGDVGKQPMTNRINSVNSLWSYNFTSQQWTWLSGSNTVNQIGSYGIKGISSPSNIPEARGTHVMVFASNINSLVMFGGIANRNTFNDLWIYNATSNNWVWIAGSRNYDEPGVYGQLGLSKADNTPGGRFSVAFGLSQNLQICYLHAGFGYDSESNAGVLSDFWSFDLTNLKIVKNSISVVSRTTTPAVRATSRTSSIAFTNLTGTIVLRTSPLIIEVTSLHASSTIDSLISTISKKSTTGRLNPTASSFNLLGLSPNALLLVSGAALICIILLILGVYRLRKKFSHTTTITNSNKRFSMTFATQTIPAKQGEFVETMFTHVPANQGISIPGFIKFEYGLDYVVGKEIASGGMASILLGDALNVQLRRYGEKIVIKKLLDTKLTPIFIQMFFQEVSIMQFLSEKRNIAKILGFSDQPYVILMKFYECGSLEKWINSGKGDKIPLRQVISLLIDITYGIQSMHSADIVHLDLKPRNILLEFEPSKRRLTASITDFGIAQIVSNQNLTVKEFKAININGASINYAAPELILKLRKNHEIKGNMISKCDLYAFGVTMFELITRRNVWKKK